MNLNKWSLLSALALGASALLAHSQTQTNPAGTVSYAKATSTSPAPCGSSAIYLIYSGWQFKDSQGAVHTFSGTSSMCDQHPYAATYTTLTATSSDGLYILTAKGPSGVVTTPTSYQGYVDPKYVVVGVTYAPPGPSSYVQYTSGTTLATTKSTSSSFSSGKTVSVQISNGTGIEGWASGHVTISNSTSVTQALAQSSSVTLSLSSQFATKTPGTPNAYSPVNHDYDIIWLWLNPVALYTITPNQSNLIQWNGYGYDTTDQPALDIWPVYVGYLNGDFGALDPSDAKVLGRAWAAGQTWPSGQGPGLTSSDYAQILHADPFASSSYAVTLASNVSPATTTDGRFTISGGASGTAQTFVYKQALPGDSPINQTFGNTYSSSSTLGQSTTTTTTETFGIDVAFTSTIFIDSLSEDLKYSQTLTWTDMASTSDTTTATQIDSLSITGPPCTATTLPCVPTYSGPPEFDVYQDNIYGSFMFNPI